MLIYVIHIYTMVYRRRTIRRSRRGRKTPWYNKKYSTAQLARTAYRGVKYIRGLVNSETFKHDVTGTFDVNNAWSVTPLNQVPVGDTKDARTGNSILQKSLMRRMRITKHSSAAHTVFRYLLIVDKQQVADTNPTGANVFELNNNIDSLLSRDTCGRFTILVDKTITLSEDKPIYHLERFHRLSSHARFNGTATTDIQRNGLYFFIMSDQATYSPTFDYYFRLTYHDN